MANASGVANITDCKGDLGKDLAAINKACCVHSGMCDTQHPVPTSCTESCGIIFGSWFSQCGKTALMGQRTAMAMMSKFEAVCRSEGTTCSSALSCAQLANKSVVNDTAGGRWPGADGNDTVCGESDITSHHKANGSMVAACYGGDSANKLKHGHKTAIQLCGGMGARLCSMDELLEGQADGSGCGHDSKFAWSSSGCGGHGTVRAPQPCIVITTLNPEVVLSCM